MDSEHNKYKIEFTEDCIDEIKEIFNYISNKLIAEKAARKLMKKLQNNIINLSKYYKLYVRISKTDIMKRYFRKMVIDNYVVLYTINEEKKSIYISHMYYSGKNYLNSGII